MSHSPSPSNPIQIQCAITPGFEAWLAEACGCLVVSTYQAHKVAAIGWDGQQTTLLLRQFDKPLGLAVSGSRMALAHRYDLTVLANAPALAEEYLEGRPGKYDALYVPRVSYHTGDLHTHDVVFQGDDLLLVNTRFSCLARLSQEYNFQPVWRPSFISDLAPEDRCHLNGLAMRDGQPRYVTALGATDIPGGWRDRKADGGIVIDLQSGEIVLDGLAMPHSPRWHDGRLWVLNSGAGELLEIDPATGRSNVVCVLPGYLRGLCLIGSYAVIGLCKIRERHIFGGLPIQGRYAQLVCGLSVVDLARGSEVGRFEFTAGCEELYDVQFLSGVRRPMILNLDRPAARQAMTCPQSSYWLRPSSEIPLGPGAATMTEQSPPEPRPRRGGTEPISFSNLLPDSGIQL